MTIKCDAQAAWVCENLMPALPGADGNQITRVFARKVAYFLQESGCWHEEADFRADTEGNVQLNFQFEKIKSIVAWIERIWHRFGVLGHVTTVPPEFRDQESSWPLVYTNTPYPDVIELWPKPGADNIVRVTARCMLTLDDCLDGQNCIPDWIWQRYREAIREGVLGEMMREIGKPYTNLSEGRQHEAKFEWWIVKARDESRRGWGMHESEWNYPRSFFV